MIRWGEAAVQGASPLKVIKDFILPCNGRIGLRAAMRGGRCFSTTACTYRTLLRGGYGGCRVGRELGGTAFSQPQAALGSRHPRDDWPVGVDGVDSRQDDYSCALAVAFSRGVL